MLSFRFQCFQRNDHAEEFHPVIGGETVTLRNFFSVFA